MFPERKILKYSELLLSDELHLEGMHAKEVDRRHSEGRKHVFAVVDRKDRDILLISASTKLEQKEWVDAINKAALL